MMQLHRINNLFYRLMIFLTLSIFFIGCDNYMFYYQKEMEQGYESYAKGDNHNAEVHFTKAIKIARKRGDQYREWIAIGALARVYAAQGMNGKAESLFKERIEMLESNDLGDFAHAESHLSLVMFYLTKKNCEAAIDALNKINKNPRIVNSDWYKESIETLRALSKFKGCSS